MSRAPGSYAGLTVTQANLLSFLREREAAECTPSFEEMRDHLDLASKSGVARLIAALEERGFIERRYNRARAIRCLDTPKPINTGDLPPIERIITADLVAELTRRGYAVGRQVMA